MTRSRFHLNHNTVLSILLLAMSLALLGFGVLLVRAKLLQNTQELGMSLARSYAAEGEVRLTSTRDFLDLGALYVEEMTREGADADTLQRWLNSYFQKVTAVVGENVIDPYAVIDGTIIAANPWSGDTDYDYQSTDWYQQALQAGGNTIFTNAYVDAITGKTVVTVAKRFADSDDILAMDLYPGNLHAQHSSHLLPTDASFYLCDSNGTLLYSSTKWTADDATMQSYTDQLLQGIRSGALAAYDTSFRDPEGVERGVYYYVMSNGWTVILTIPISTVLMGDRNVVIWVLIFISAVLFITLVVMVVRDLFRSRSMARADNTIHILGDSFYAIYRVNYKLGLYESIKTAGDTGDVLGERGDYADLLDAMRSRVIPETFQEFQQAFSLESIRQRVAARVADYGGDYQRRFGQVYKWVNIRTLYDGERAPDEVILCFREVDLEKRRQLQHMQLLQEALEASKKSAQAKTNFFSRMSHDMRTPLNAIIGLSSLAQTCPEDPEKQADYMHKIQFSSQQLLTLINDILELSRLESGQHVLEYKPFDLKACVEENTSLFRELAVQEHKTLRVQVEVTQTQVMGDAFKVGQILNNLISNAFKYSEEGAVIEVTVRQYAFRQHSKFQIVVADTGLGMSEEFLSRLFDPYARETHFTTRSVTGTGLGMPIVKSLVQQMSGEITVESTLGKGSRFIVTLPLNTVDQAPASDAPPADVPPLPDLSGRRLLVAEDNDLNREIITELLAMNDVQVVSASNGDEAVKAFQAAPLYSIDAILMDMQMPVMDGCQAARAIRALDRPDAAQVPIVAVTANAFAEDIARTTEAGMTAHISKPIDYDVLLRTLAQQLAPPVSSTPPQS